MMGGLLVSVALLLPFAFYYVLWTYPQLWVDFCGKDTDPSHRMAQVSHILKAVQFIAFFSVARLSWPPWYCLVLFIIGQFLNFRASVIFWGVLGRSQ